jgi:uncharacterized RDD family membrane protein YckC
VFLICNNTLQIEQGTTMNKASLVSRLIAIIIDNIVIGIVAAILAGITGNSGIGTFAGFVLAVLYNGYFWTTNNGQTPGKGLMKIRVVKADGTGFTWTDAIIRVVGYYISGFVFAIGFIRAIFDPERQTWADKIAKTYVVDA